MNTVGHGIKTVDPFGRIKGLGMAALLALSLVLTSATMPSDLGNRVGVQQASAAQNLGGLNIDGFCVHKYGGTAARQGRDAGSWRCRVVSYTVGLPPGASATVQFYRLDLNEACRWQYGSRAYAMASNWSNPYSWRCYR